ncbi:MAG: branched-chain amino acid ABC transporter permease [Rhizobiales bacterium]|nr:branched-chain amino acid ABC transporter permease [Hyphomicrobiales bacterium]
MTGDLFNFGYQFLVNISFLMFAAMGLIIVLGMLNIINLAHGEFIMMGAYATTLLVHAGVPFVVAVVVATIIVGLIGIVVERLVIRRFYGNRLNALVATFGLSLMLSQGTLLIFGPFLKGIRMPLGGFRVGEYSYATYLLVVAILAFVLLFALWLLFYRTRLSIDMRAILQNPDMARALGVNTSRIHTFRFAHGAALAGLTGALYAPTTTIVPLFGTAFIAPAFITVVIGGGADPLIGALASSVLLSTVSTPLSSQYGTFAGRIGLMLAALIIMRFLPDGLSYYVRAAMLRRRKARPEGAR